MIFGCRSMDTGRRPLCGCFVLPPARPEKAKPFQAGQSPCTKHLQTVRLRLYAPKKVFEGSKGRFFKNASWQGVGQRPTKGGQATHRGTPFQAGRSPCTKHQQTVRLCLYTPKSFWGFQGAFFQKRALGRVKEESHKEKNQKRPQKNAQVR